MTLPGFTPCPECENGQQYCGTGLYEHPHRCPSCGGAGQTPDETTVEAVAIAIWEAEYDDTPAIYEEWQLAYSMARAALLAYARHTQETKP